MLIADQQGTTGRPLPDVIVRAANGIAVRTAILSAAEPAEVAYQLHSAQ